MILTCPSCGTQYAVKDGAIPEGGRKVRCAACGHSWHQEPETGDFAIEDPAEMGEAEARPDREPEPSDFADPIAPIPAPAPEPGDPAAAATGFDEMPGEPEPVGYEPVEAIPPGAELVEGPTSVPVPPPGDEPWPEPRSDEQQWDPEKEILDAEEILAAETETPRDRKRNWLMAALIGIVVVIAIVAALWFLAPDSLRQRIGFAGAGPSPLQIAAGTPERQKLVSGNELVMVSGRVINPSSKPQPVPPIQAELRDKGGKLLYSWTITPPARTLQPGASATFNSAQMDVPASGLDSTVTLSLKG
jgi:predicted Zn finger-like uncharacterized protein